MSLAVAVQALVTGLATGAAYGLIALGFTLVFLQGLISWFMTPAPTLWLELYYDVVNALWGGAIAGTLSVGLGPLLCRKAPADAAIKGAAGLFTALQPPAAGTAASASVAAETFGIIEIRGRTLSQDATFKISNCDWVTLAPSLPTQARASLLCAVRR